MAFTSAFLAVIYPQHHDTCCLFQCKKYLGELPLFTKKKVTISPPLTAFLVKVCNFNQMLPNIYKRLQKML